MKKDILKLKVVLPGQALKPTIFIQTESVKLTRS